MKNWWLVRTRSEQVLLGVGAVCVALTAWYLTLVEPLGLEHERRVTRLQAATATNGALGAMAQEARSLRGRATVATTLPAGKSLLSVINVSGGRAGTQVFTRRVNPIGEDSVALVLDDVPFALLTNWLVDLDTSEGIAVERASIERAAPGLANARVTLRARRAE